MIEDRVQDAVDMFKSGKTIFREGHADCIVPYRTLNEILDALRADGLASDTDEGTDANGCKFFMRTSIPYRSAELTRIIRAIDSAVTRASCSVRSASGSVRASRGSREPVGEKSLTFHQYEALRNLGSGLA